MMNSLPWSLLLLWLVCQQCGIDGKMSCIGEGGQPVDMFVIYKLPAIKWYDTPQYVHNGSAYAILYDDYVKFTLSTFPITSVESSAGRTLNQVYSAHKNGNTPTDQAHVFYNDANPEGKEFFTHGHTKGTVAFDGETGFWMVHSVPRYPPAAKDGYGYPPTGHLYGQMYMCVTLNSSTINDIGLQLRYNNPHVHDSNLPDAMKSDFPNIDQLLQGQMVKTSPYKHLQSFTSLNGAQFLSFAKGTKFNDDLYDGFVAPTLQTDLLTETWQHGSHNIGSSCDGQYTVEDITGIELKLSEKTAYSFYDMNDHSKFAVGKTSMYVCIGDINRQTSQYKRGGGTVCTYNIVLWEQFHSIVSNITACK